MCMCLKCPRAFFLSVKAALKTAQAEAGLSTTARTLKQDLILKRNCDLKFCRTAGRTARKETEGSLV